MVTFAAAYAFVWLALAFYVGWMSRRQRRLLEQYARLQNQFSDVEAPETEDNTSLRRAA